MPVYPQSIWPSRFSIGLSKQIFVRPVVSKKSGNSLVIYLLTVTFNDPREPETFAMFYLSYFLRSNSKLIIREQMSFHSKEELERIFEKEKDL